MNLRRIPVVLAVALLVGCPDSKPKGDLPPVHPAKGKVVRGGVAVNGGSIRLHPEPEDLDMVVGGEVDGSGGFELHTMNAQSQKKSPGAPVGTYRVTFFPALGDQTAGPNPAPVEVRDKVTIKEGPNDLTIDLGGKK